MVDNGELKQCFKCEINYFVFQKDTGVGKTLYEYAWKKNDEMADTNQFCIEDVFEKVQFRKGLKLTKSQCGRVLEFYQMEDGDIIF